MRNTPADLATIVNALNARILEGVALQEKIEALKERLDTIKASIDSDLTELGQPHHVTAEGYQAMRIDTVTRQWAVDLLEKVLPKMWFDRLCPRKAETAKLSTLLELLALPPEALSKKIAKSKGKITLPGIGFAELRACSSAKNNHRIELRAPNAPVQEPATEAQAVNA